jgi:hypothetical protein
MKFKYQKIPAKESEAFPERKFILRPIIPVILEYGKRKVGYWALIDSGADYSIFHADIGEILELDIRSGKKETFGGIGGGKFTAYFHLINAKIGFWKYKFYCGFSYDIPPFGYGVLGQKGFFDIFIVKFDLVREEIEVEPRFKKMI